MTTGVQKAIQIIENDIAKLQQALLLLRSFDVPEAGKESVLIPIIYNKDLRWNQKIAFVLNLFPQGLSTVGIVEELSKYETEYSREKLMSSISATLAAGRHKLIFERTKKAGHWFYKNF